MIAESLNVGGGVRLTGKTVYVHAKHYKHNEDGRKAPDVCGNGSVPLSRSGNLVTRIGTHTHTHRAASMLVWVFVASLCSLPAATVHHREPSPRHHSAKVLSTTVGNSIMLLWLQICGVISPTFRVPLNNKWDATRNANNGKLMASNL